MQVLSSLEVYLAFVWSRYYLLQLQTPYYRCAKAPAGMIAELQSSLGSQFHLESSDFRHSDRTVDPSIGYSSSSSSVAAVAAIASSADLGTKIIYDSRLRRLVINSSRETVPTHSPS